MQVHIMCASFDLPGLCPVIKGPAGPVELKCSRKRGEPLIYSILVTVTLFLPGTLDRHKVLGLGMKYLAAGQHFPLFHSCEPPLTQHEHRRGLKELHDCTSQQ